MEYVVYKINAVLRGIKSTGYVQQIAVVYRLSTARQPLWHITDHCTFDRPTVLPAVCRFAYRMISELVIVNIFGSRGTARSSRSAQFTEHRWSHAAQPESGTTALRPEQACRYIDRAA
jgi:hypothetical protein